MKRIGEMLAGTDAEFAIFDSRLLGLRGVAQGDAGPNDRNPHCFLIHLKAFIHL